MATIKDIAKKAGVAQGTVSNVLNGKGNVSSDKIRRVLEAARQLGYVPNERAALLRKGTNDCLALVMPDSRARQRRHCRRDIEASVCLQEILIIPVKKISAGAS